jgi:hypothetical protein
MVVVKAAASIVVVLLFLAVGILGPAGLARVRRGVGRLAERWRPHRHSSPDVPSGRPIELIAVDAHRLGRQFHCLPRGVSFARFEARRRAYDTVLTEACRSLEIEHLLGVLPAGPDLDVERERVETALGLAGLRLGDAA